MTRAYMPLSKSTEYETPHDLFDKLWKEFGPFDLDPCGQKEVHYSAHRIVQHGGGCYDGSTMALDGLTQPWRGRVFCNPPYGRGLDKWVEKAHSEAVYGRAELVVALLPVRTDTKWWQENVLVLVQRLEPTVSSGLRTHGVDGGADAVRFLRGRLRFHGEKGVAPFSSCIVVWGKL